MAEMDPRKKLLQNLMQELENYQLPERYTAEQKKKIMSGRSGQAEIDEGRRTIAENEKLYQDAVTKRGELQERVRTVTNEIGGAESTAREQEQEDWERSPIGQAYEGGKVAVPAAAGMYLGHKTAGGIERRQKAMSPARQQSMGTGRRFAPYAGKAMTYFIPEGLALREYVAPRMKEGMGRDMVNAGGTGLLAAGAVTTGEGLARSLTPQAIPGIDDKPPTMPDNALSRAAPPQALPPPNTPPAAPTQPATNSERLERAAREAGARGKMTKAQAAQYLAGNVTAKNRAAVARELGVNPGPNFASRLSGKVRDMASTTRRLPGVALPIVAGTMAYDAASSSAEARGAGPVEQTATGAGAATVAGGTTAAAMKGGQYLSKVPGIGAAARFLGKAAGPMMLSEGAGELMRQGIDRGLLRDPAQMGGGQPQNALSAADPGSSDFGQALDAFMQFVTQEMAGQGGAQDEMQVSP
jgi:hypothetical protein